MSLVNKCAFLIVLSFFFLLIKGFSLTVSLNDTHRIAEKIWKNECHGSTDKLVHWNKGENFPSLGIGHFIWYPDGVKEPFQETFPDLLKYLQKHEIALPAWLKSSKNCPWATREDFYHSIQSPEMIGLRQLLFETKDLQAIFITERLENALPRLLQNLSKNEKEKVAKVFYLLANDSKGLYALIDYVNFKGEGISADETYKGQGWGLLQVLQKIPFSSQDIISDFVKAAKELLCLRVENAPPERHEELYLKGWLNRLDTYLIN